MTGLYDHQSETPASRPNARTSRSDGWDWWNGVDGALALQPELDPAPVRRLRSGSKLKEARASGTVPRMAWPQAPGLATRVAQRDQERLRARRARRIAALLVVTGVCVVTLLLTAFGTGGSTTLASSTSPAPAERLLPSGPPQPQVVALRDSLRVQLPIAQGRVTAIGYHAAGTGALALQPVGTQANAGIFGRLLHRLLGDSSSGLSYYLLDGGVGPQTGGLDVGAPVDTDVYAPVDGTIIAISDQIVNGRRFGVRIDLQPSGNPGYVVTLENLRVDPSLNVGTTVSAARSKIGRVIDLSSVERAGLARFTQDRGQHVHIEVHAAASLTSP
ncbi:MAG: hypothetical protein ACR2L0_02510 [Gaiellaceae bacterium]